VITPEHLGRFKDVRDLIEIGTANEIVNKTGIADSIIKYANLMTARNEAVSESAIAKYITKRQRIPTNKGVKALASEKFETSEKYLVAKRA